MEGRALYLPPSIVYTLGYLRVKYPGTVIATSIVSYRSLLGLIGRKGRGVPMVVRHGSPLADVRPSHTLLRHTPSGVVSPTRGVSLSSDGTPKYSLPTAALSVLPHSGGAGNAVGSAQAQLGAGTTHPHPALTARDPPSLGPDTVGRIQTRASIR